MEFNKTKSYKNLVSSFAGECQDGARYQFMAMKAQQEGLVDLQNNLKSLAKEEMNHAERIFNLLTSLAPCNDGTKCEIGSVEGVCITATYPFKNGSLLEMLEFTSKTEKQQKDVIYKEFAQAGKKEGYDEVYTLFTLLAEVENCHSLLLNEFYTMLKSKKLYAKPNQTTWKCSACGHEHKDKSAPKVCPLCQKPQGNYYIKSSRYRYFEP